MHAILAVLLLSANALAEMPSRPVLESQAGSMGYPTVSAARDAARAAPGAEIEVQNGWTIVSIREERVLWSFAPETDPAYPSAVRRVVSESNGALVVSMSVLCQAEKASCDRLVQDFQALNERMKDDFARRGR
ncbi:hypothetical protein ACQQ2N_03155 [Dokdonella sp. MW10]|uniref:hypothetical protein n=1 Tax=Dokdonella sp. MW10 TaxID=2992926 RepID=UPI003F7EFDAB